MIKITDILNLPVIYKLWQFPFCQQKVYFLKQDLKKTDKELKVLDLGCGPGTNLKLFKNHQYTGVDINPLYIKNIASNENRQLVCQDVNTFLTHDKKNYDLILVNSLMHHLDDTATCLLLSQAAQRLNKSGKIYIFDLIMPDEKSIPRFLAVYDRGKFARPADKWSEFFCTYFQKTETKCYYLKFFGIKLWSMIYFKGERFD